MCVRPYECVYASARVRVCVYVRGARSSVCFVSGPACLQLELAYRQQQQTLIQTD